MTLNLSYTLKKENKLIKIERLIRPKQVVRNCERNKVREKEQYEENRVNEKRKKKNFLTVSLLKLHTNAVFTSSHSSSRYKLTTNLRTTRMKLILTTKDDIYISSKSILIETLDY